ncbi:MAG: carbonic anhydrase [Candidatus Eremiobacteraeota bacterium]|nr:carbonic anhydrase [Candidatus Eremiobacteraeota bacterium]
MNAALTNQNGLTERRLALTGHQAPFAAVLSCSDSRVPPELIFDASIGDLFVVRNAGNVVTPAALGTLEYGYGALGIKLILVLGHEKCGAVSATYDAIRDKKPLPPNLDVLQRAIEPGIAQLAAARASSEQGALHAAVVANAKAQAANLRKSAVLGAAIRNGDCTVVAADYGFEAGKVSFLT